MRKVCPVSNHLGEADILHYISLSTPQSKSSDDDFSVTPYIVDGDTVMFVVNYSSGWEILSADARTPLLLAKSDAGRLSLDTDSPEGLWISLMAADMKRVIESSDDELVFSQEEIDANRSRWPTSRMFDPNLPFTPEDSLEVFGHWELFYEGYEQETVDTIPHLTVTQWDQIYPYNIYCPSNSPVGCAAVAAGQMLYYLHDKYGMPICSHAGTILDSLSTTYSSNLSPAVDYTASFLYEAGIGMNMHYFGDFSWALPYNVVNFFSSYGYDCTYGSFSESAVKSSLMQELPVIVLAMDEFGSSGIPDPTGSHYFLIDGYMKKREFYVKKYMFVREDNSYQTPIPEEYRTEVVSIFSPYIAAVKMNWGWSTQWGGSSQNDSWYLLTGSWVDYDDGVHYDTARHIISGFSYRN